MMTYDTIQRLSNIGYIDMKNDIGEQKMTIEKWHEVHPYMTNEQRNELTASIKRVADRLKDGEKLPELYKEILKDIETHFLDLPF
jgi:hypothetical protein